MPKIEVTSFKDFLEKVEFLNDEEVLTYGDALRMLTPQGIEILKNEVRAFKTEQLEPFKKMLEKYFFLDMPEDFQKKVLLSDLELAAELLNGAITDTYVRSGVIYQVMCALGAFKSIYEDNEYNNAYRKLNFPEAYLSDNEDLKNNELVVKIKQQVVANGGKILSI